MPKEFTMPHASAPHVPSTLAFTLVLLTLPAFGLAQPPSPVMTGQPATVTSETFTGVPGSAHCLHGVVSTLIDPFDELSAAAAPHPSVGAQALQQAIRDFCEPVVVDLPPLPGDTSSAAIAVNDHGRIAGTSGSPSGSIHAVMWERGVVTDLGLLAGGSRTAATAINNRGQIVGYGDTTSGQQHAFLWELGRLIDLGPLEPGGSGVARWLNDHGQVVGEGETASTGTTHGVIWHHGAVVDLGAGVAFSNNQRGQVVGYNVFGGAFVWDHGTFTRIGAVSGGTFSLPTSINEHGQVVGWSESAANTTHAFLWTNRRIRDLGTLAGSGGASIANAINDRGQVVGSTSTPSGETHAFFWDRGTMVDVGTLPGGTSSDAFAINAHSQVAGLSRSPSDSALFLWQDGELVNTGIAWSPRNETSAQIMNNRGEIVGQHTLPSGEVHAALWTRRAFRHDHQR
jgi:probable HAF family extracellular repeat protein